MSKQRFKEITKTILTTLAEMAIAHFEAFQWPYWKKYDSNTVYITMHRLKKQGLIEIIKEKGKKIIKITKKGRKKVLEYKIGKLKIQKPKKWDGKWRIVIFDIPNEKRLARNVLRRKLKELGFYPFQKSVFVCPYECQKEINLIREVYEVEPYVRLIVADSIEEEKTILKYFNL